MYPAVFGPVFWDALHLATLAYPHQPSAARRESMRLFLENLCPNLPCGGCGHHCIQYLRAHPPATASRKALVAWGFDFHNAVNRRTGKRELPHAEAEARLRRKYFQVRDWVDTKRAQDQRLEDHAALARLEARNARANHVILGLLLVLGLGLGVAVRRRAAAARA